MSTPKQQLAAPNAAATPVVSYHAGASGEEAATRRGESVASQRPALTLRLVISSLAVLTVLVVAAVTFGITYQQGVASSGAMGKRFTMSLAAAGRNRMEDSFRLPTKLQAALGSMLRQPGLRLPTDEMNTTTTTTTSDSFTSTMSSAWSTLDVMLEATLLMVLSDPAVFTSVDAMFDDGSRLVFVASNGSSDTPTPTTTSTSNSGLAQIAGSSAAASTQTDSDPTTTTEFLIQQYHHGLRAWRAFRIPLASMARERLNASVFEPVDARLPWYVVRRPLAVATRPGLWQDAAYVPPYYTLPSLSGMFNGSDAFLGIHVVGVSVAAVESFLLSLDRTANSHAFAVDSYATVVASTHPHNGVTLSTTQTREDAVRISGRNCASSITTSRIDTQVFSVACRPYARDHPYGPLRTLSAEADLMFPDSDLGVILVERTAGDTGAFFAATSGIGSDHAAFPLALLVFVPKDDVLGDVFRARDTAIAVVAAIVVAACAASFAAVSVMLQPLVRVGERMALTAQLREESRPSGAAGGDAAVVAEAEKHSAFREIYDLQTAFGGMDTAIKSFTRYVPRDVVKDLLASGQLCEIKMVPRQCTVLFSDIANFTTMCEEVPAEVLSGLVLEYFETMTDIVVGHGGVVDKFIGDAIMALWGCPVAIANAETRATLCALQLDTATRQGALQAAFDDAGENLSIRVGVASGSVLAGNMGSRARMNYTVIGDDVNLAARLESLNKQLGTRVLISDSTADLLAHGVFVTRLLHHIAVVGKSVAVGVWEPLGLVPLDRMDPTILDALDHADATVRHDNDRSFNDSMSMSMGDASFGNATAESSARGASGHRSPSGSIVNVHRAAGHQHQTAPAVRRHRGNTSTLIRRAVATTGMLAEPYPTVLQAADLHSDAVRAFRTGDIQRAVALLNRAAVARAAADPPTVKSAAGLPTPAFGDDAIAKEEHPAVALLRSQLSEAARRSATGSDADEASMGVWTPSAK